MQVEQIRQRCGEDVHLFMNLCQQPHIMDTVCGNKLPCLTSYYSHTMKRWLLPLEKMGCHLLPTRLQYARAMGLPYPFYKAGPGPVSLDLPPVGILLT